MFGSHTVRIGTITALFLGSLLYLTLCMDQAVNVYDEGITLFGADRVMHGDVPHRDFYALYGPAQFYIIAGLYKLFGASVLVERAWTAIVSGVSIVLIFLIVDRFVLRRFAVLAAIAALFWFQNAHAYGLATLPCLALMLAGLLLLVPVLGQAAAAPRLLGAGVCAGVTMLFRYDVGLAVFGAECGLLVISIWFTRSAAANRVRAIVRDLLVFGAGFAIVTVPVAIAYGMNGVLSDLFFDVVVFPSKTYARMRGLPLPRLGMLRKDPVEFIGVYLPLIVCVAALPTLVAAVVSRKSALMWTLGVLLVLDVISFGKGFVRASTSQMAMALILCAPLATLAALPIPGRGRIGTAIAVAGLVVFLGVTAASQYPDLAVIAHNLASPPNCHPQAGLERMACFEVSPEAAQTVRYVQQHTERRDPIFIGLVRHDKIFVNDVTLYFTLNRPSATKWHHFDPGLQTTAPIQREMIGELQRARPKLIIIERLWEVWHEPNDSVVSSGVTLLDDYIRQSYESAATFGAYTILRTKTS